MNYIPSTEKERSEQLKALGYNSFDDLYSMIPAPARIKGIQGLPKAMSESELFAHVNTLAAMNAVTDPCFRGAGAYDHTIPAAVPALLSMSQFVTAYTPYQPEISQGTLTGIFEFQTMMCQLTGLDVSNASIYDGATSACEAMLMAVAQTRRKHVTVSAAVHPHIISTLKTYARFNEIEVELLPVDMLTGQTIAPEKETGAVFVQSPNYFGIIENMTAIAAEAKKLGATAVAVCDPISLGLLKSPGECGFDIAVGECQPLGLRLSFGGPYAGFLCAKESFVRRMPGRIVGETVDSEGRRVFVLTLQAREQHIRREKATSNICSNQALCALTATVWLSLMGAAGLREAAELTAQKAAYARQQLIEKDITPLYSGPFFREIAVNKAISSAVCLSGDTSLIAVTEKRTKAEIDAFIEKAAKQ